MHCFLLIQGIPGHVYLVYIRNHQLPLHSNTQAVLFLFFLYTQSDQPCKQSTDWSVRFYVKCPFTCLFFPPTFHWPVCSVWQGSCLEQSASHLFISSYCRLRMTDTLGNNEHRIEKMFFCAFYFTFQIRWLLHALHSLRTHLQESKAYYWIMIWLMEIKRPLCYTSKHCVITFWVSAAPVQSKSHSGCKWSAEQRISPVLVIQKPYCL